MQDFSAVLFDLDGTLLDTAGDLGNALNHVMRQYDRPEVAYRDYRLIASNGAMGLLKLGFGEELDQIDFAHARKILLDYYASNICHKTLPFDGVSDLLTHLNQINKPWGIVTNKPAALTEKLLAHFPLMANCRSVISGDTLSVSKPHPEPLLLAAKQLQIDPAKALYVGDALRDIQAANAAKMGSVIARYGYIAKDENLAAWQADYIIDSVDELKGLG